MIIQWLDVLPWREHMSAKDRERFDQLRQKDRMEELTPDEKRELLALVRKVRPKVGDAVAERGLRREQTGEEMLAEIDRL